MDIGAPDIAVWVVTSNGLLTAKRLKDHWPTTTVMCSQGLAERCEDFAVRPFSRLPEAVTQMFHRFGGHVFIMATGIVVRVIAPHLRDKTRDPAVVTMDDRGRFAISLLSGHIGGANALARTVADIVGAEPVITTATDSHQMPAIDLIAVAKNLFIENPAAIKSINMAVLEGKEIHLHDPYRLVWHELSRYPVRVSSAAVPVDGAEIPPASIDDGPFVFIDDTVISLPPTVLILRPASLAVGIGCNRHTPKEEIRDLLKHVLNKNRLSPASVTCIATIDLKADETGIIDLARELDLPLVFFSRQELAEVEDIPNPSATVQKFIGVHSVCEAAALLASRKGKLIVPKQASRNVTVAIARTPYTS